MTSRSEPLESLEHYDNALWLAIEAERRRQETRIELVASENYVSRGVLEATGSILTNKYAEGYPGRRHYGNCEEVDAIEGLAIDRAKALFKAEYANVQPYSGSTANAAVMAALLEPGDTLLAMSTAAGGHSTHGAGVHQSGRFYRAFHYGVNPATGRIDYDRVQALAERHRPKLIVAGFSAYSRVVDWGRIRGIADGIGAYMLADVAHVAGLIAAGLYPSPVPIADVVTSTTHKTLRGPRGGLILAKAAKDLPERLDAGVFPGLQGGPLMHVVAAKAVAFKEATEPGFRVYCAQVVKNARAMAERCAARGYLIVSGGTDNHLFLIDLQERKLTGRVAAAWLREAGINVNECQVPADPEPEGVASGIRLGTPATTTRGLDETESATLADWVCDVLDARGDARVIDAVQSRARDWCDRHPIP